ncbi:MAG: gas vesicle protein K [Myxococcota bacterium]|jgi:hypothetical protein
METSNLDCVRVESNALDVFARALPKRTSATPRRLNLDQDKLKNGLGQLVLTLVKLLHELLEKQAIRRMDSGSLTDDEIERLGVTLMRQAQEIERMRKEFGLEEEDLNLDLGPLGKLL